MASKPNKPKASAAPDAGQAAAPIEAGDLKDLRVVEFGLTNFMRIDAVVIKPDGPVVQLTGRNRQGKSSVIRALRSVFAGKGALPREPIRRGQVESRVWAILGRDGKPEILVEEQLTLAEDGVGEVGRKLIVKPVEGRAFREPQAVLDRLFEPIAFAPFDFSRADPKKQLDVVKALVPGVDFDKIAERRKDLFDDRTQVGRERDRAKAHYQSLAVPDPKTPLEEVDISELVSQMASASEHNDLLARRQRTREEADIAAKAKRKEAVEHRKIADGLDAEAAELETRLAEAPELPEPIDVSDLQRQIDNATATNTSVRAKIVYGEARATHAAKVTEYDLITSQIAQLDVDKSKAIEDAHLPVPGLSLADDGLMLNGLPFEQASGRERLETAVRIGMAMNPDLKLIVAEEGNLLDDDGLATLEALAERHGFLVVIERVTNGEAVGFVIEDGGLVS